LKLSRLLLISFGFVLALTVITTVIGVVRVNQVDAILENVNQVDSLKQRYAINFRGSVHDRAISIRDAVLVAEASERAPHLIEIQRLEEFYSEAAIAMDALFEQATNVTQNETSLLNNIKAIERRTQTEAAQILRLLDAGQQEQARLQLLDSTSGLYSQWLASINAFIDYQEAAIQRQVQSVRDITGHFQVLMISVTLIGFLLAGLVIWALNRYLQRLLGAEPVEAARVIREIASGNLQVDAKTDFPDSIMGAIAQMRNDLVVIMTDLGSTASSIARSSLNLHETAQANQMQAQNQRLQTEQGGAAIHEMSMTIQEVARHSAEAAATAGNATSESRNGATDVQSTIDSIHEVSQQIIESSNVISQLSQDSEQIGSVVEVIESIAEQTNLLALNAAIEAARAGEFGRGFAVVADEVRALASRSRNSTQDIQTLVDRMRASATGAVAVIEAGKLKVDRSVEQATCAGQSLAQINSSVDSITRMNEHIASATEEQSVAALEISRNFSSIQELSELSERASREVSQACDHLTASAEQLREVVGKFRLPA
jgi:methyl-accepting chemotaxis protein